VPAPSGLVAVDDLRAARAALDTARVLRRTPLFASDSLSRLAGRPILLKCEHQQRTGSFKIRGAWWHIRRLLDRGPADHVVAASAGNHAQGVALAAALLGVRSTVFMPTSASWPKVVATEDYGAEVRLAGDTLAEAMAAARELATETGAHLVPPFDDPDVVAGQGTLGLELAEEVPDGATVVVPIGGGGLVSGVAVALAASRPDVRVVGVQAAGAPSMRRALDAGHPVGVGSMDTMADGIRVGLVADLTLAHVEALVADVVLVDDEAISRALLLLVERTKAVVEPSAATSLAAVLEGLVDGDGPVVPLLSGGNVDPTLLVRMLRHGLAASGRQVSLRVVIVDAPGQLHRMLGVLAERRLDVVDVDHQRSDRRLRVGEVEVEVTVEARDPDDARAAVEELRAQGYRAELR
jgi:threonine dehydratase